MDNTLMAKYWQRITLHYRYIALAIIIAGLITSLIWQLVLFVQVLRTTVFTPSDVATTKISTAPSYHITDFTSLFGMANEKSNKQFIPKTSLNLKLKGALSGINNTLSSAIIQGNDGIDRLYKQGDKLPGGATLEQVHERYVIIQYQGVPQKILFPDDKPKAPLRQSSQLPTTRVMHSLKQQQEDTRQIEHRIDALRNKLRPPAS